MGTQFFDQYSLLHASAGVIVYFSGVPLWFWNVMHIIFEVVENTPFGMKFINAYFPFWPGGKRHSDTITNRVGDVISGYIGWMLAQKTDLLFTSSFPKSSSI